jgi:hypothetical protein
MIAAGAVNKDETLLARSKIGGVNPAGDLYVIDVKLFYHCVFILKIALS